MNWLSKQITINSQLVSYVARPGTDKKTLIILHGWRSTGAVWKNFSEELPSDIAVFVPDLPGFGGSEAPRKPFAVSDYAAIIAEFIKKMDLRNVCLAGHSFGGRIAIKLAAESPNLVEKLLLIGAAGTRPQSTRLKIIGRTAKFFRPIFRLPGIRNLRPLAYKAIGAEDYTANPELTETFKRVITEDLAPFCEKIKAPTLIIWGDKDKETPLADGRRMAELIPGANFLELSGGHHIYLEQPESVRAEIYKFINS